MKVYLDNAATTKLDSRVFSRMKPYLGVSFGNPSSFHSIGKEADNAVEDARKSIANVLGCRNFEIVFCSGGTESDNMAILGVARANQGRGNHLITSQIEHHAVLEPMSHLEKREGFKVSYIGVDKNGMINPKDIEKALTKKTTLVSVMMANNEIGTIQPIQEIGKIILKWRKRNNTNFPLFHTDACQAAGALDLDVERLHVDLLTLNGSKIYGPKGVGILYTRKGIELEPIFFGGAQEIGKRPGTQNVAGIVGLAGALELGQKNKEKENKRLINLRDYFVRELLKIPGTRLNGDPIKRLPNNVNISFLDIEGEAMILYLDAKGIYVSSGSACTSRTLDPSHVLIATGVGREAAHSSVRFTLGHDTTKPQINYVLKSIPGIVKKLREISPTKHKYDK